MALVLQKLNLWCIADRGNSVESVAFIDNSISKSLVLKTRVNNVESVVSGGSAYTNIVLVQDSKRNTVVDNVVVSVDSADTSRNSDSGSGVVQDNTVVDDIVSGGSVKDNGVVVQDTRVNTVDDSILIDNADDGRDLVQDSNSENTAYCPIAANNTGTNGVVVQDNSGNTVGDDIVSVDSADTSRNVIQDSNSGNTVGDDIVSVDSADTSRVVGSIRAGGVVLEDTRVNTVDYVIPVDNVDTSRNTIQDSNSGNTVGR